MVQVQQDSPLGRKGLVDGQAVLIAQHIAEGLGPQAELHGPLLPVCQLIVQGAIQGDGSTAYDAAVCVLGPSQLQQPRMLVTVAKSGAALCDACGKQQVSLQSLLSST